MAGAKGKSIDMASGSGIGVDLVDGTSSKGSTAGRRSTATTDNPEVVCEDADWWDQYGGDYPDLQYFANRIVGQCMSSSGCEQNWSTFALVHTKLRNRLSYDKLHKLVSVHYNLKLRIQQYEDDIHSLQDMQIQHEMDSDPYSMLMDAAVFDDRNPIMDWLVNSRSESTPILDENVDGESEFPSRSLIDEFGLSDEDVAILKEIYGPKQNISKKRRIQFDEEESAEDIESDSAQGSPIYAESGDSASHESEGDDGAGTTNAQPATSPLRPRSKRVRKVPVKNLY